VAIERWEPFREMVSLRDAMNSLLQESFIRPTLAMADGGSVALPWDIAETEDEFVIRASMPGVRPDDVQIMVHGDTLTIRGECKAEEERKDQHWHMRECRHGSFQRSATLGAQVNADMAQACFDNGILTLHLPKSEVAKPKQIKITSTHPAQVSQTPTKK
jgi:HSP20 family protein